MPSDASFDPAAVLAAAHAAGGPVSFPGDKPTDLASAEAIQDALIARCGWTAAAWKLGATTHAARAALGLPRAFSGLIPAARVHDSGARLPMRIGGVAVGVEVEPAVRIARDVTAGDLPSPDRVGDLVASAHCAIEVPLTRFAALGSEGPLALVADNGASGHAVIGPAAPRAALEGPLTASVSAGGTTLATGDRTALLALPLALLHDHLVRVTGRGYAVRAGEVVLLGSLTPYRAPPPPAVVTVAIEGMGEVTLRVEDEEGPPADDA